MDGFLLIDKEKGISSNKVDNKIKYLYKLNKVGHIGTLDPLAHGLLVLGINKGTRFIKYFENHTKEYIFRIRLGATSPSLDNETEISNKIDTNLLNKEELIDGLIESTIKTYNQYPPLYSAIKINGQKLCNIVSKGKTDIDVNSREVTIYDAKRVSDIEYINESSYFDIYLKVSKGFYVRSYATELASLLDTIGLADDIYRISVGDFNIKNINSINNLIDPMDYIKFKRIEIDDNTLYKALNGVKLTLSNCSDEYVVLTHKGRNIAIYRKDDSIYRMDLLIENDN